MGKTSQKRLMRRQGQANNIGCMSGLIRMFYSRHDAKLLLDRKQGSTRHTFTGFTGRGHSRKNSRDLDEIDEDGNNMEECSSSKPTVKRLMEDELAGKVKRLKIPNDEVQRILADLGHDVCLDKRSTQNNKSKGDQNHSTSITVSAPSRRLDPSGSNSMEEAEENELEFALADLLGQIQRYHDEQPHKNCRNKGELCTELKVLIQKKLNELDNPPCSLGYEQTPQGEEKDTADGKRLRSSSVTRPKQFRDTFEMLSSDTELLFKIPEKSNSHNLESVQRHENRQIGTGLVPTKMPENTKDTKSPSQHELVTKTRGRESRHIFFWKKERPNRTHTAEGTNSSQPVNKIVILKPNTIGGANPAVAVSSTDQYPELSAAESSKFSITEVRRRFRIVTSEARKGKPTVCEDGLQKHPHWFKKSAFTIKKDTRQLAEQTSEEKALSTGTKDFRSSSMSRKKQRHDGPSEINSNIMASPKDESAFYDEAKKHLTEILKDKSQTAKYPILQRTRSLVRMLSLPQCNTPSPRSSPRAKDCIYLSPEEANIHAIYKEKREEFAKEEIHLGKISESFACEAQHKQAVQEMHCINEESQETTQDNAELDTLLTEEIDKLDCIPAEHCRYKPLQDMVEEAEAVKEHVAMVTSPPGNDVPECQEPTTPRSSAPIELISQFSPDGNHEKQEQPSPVSVLYPFLHEDVDSPNNENIIKCELNEDILRSQYTTADGSDHGVFWEDKDVRLGYIEELLELSELCRYQNLEVWYLEDELISPCLFEELHQGNQIDDMKLLFDCICEAVTEVQGIYFSPACLSPLKRNIRAPPTGRNLISEINKQVERHLHYQFPSTLDQLVIMDLEGGSWMNLGPESEEITVVIWDCILDELLEEAVYDLWI
ncbi:uncharacterized protein LOC112874238 isoform X2 [Panicum hallii]|uniref:uncharacterized protein LOC112874238 isoform X2 n=1 Tax=Panicum hallii TaxID=206008 RepID=UPI000DF4EFDE|nr:uncharacterized protein LOC112874238 isoform X2 [Panicum hallii]